MADNPFQDRLKRLTAIGEAEIKAAEKRLKGIDNELDRVTAIITVTETYINTLKTALDENLKRLTKSRTSLNKINPLLGGVEYQHRAAYDQQINSLAPLIAKITGLLAELTNMKPIPANKHAELTIATDLSKKIKTLIAEYRKKFKDLDAMRGSGLIALTEPPKDLYGAGKEMKEFFADFIKAADDIKAKIVESCEKATSLTTDAEAGLKTIKDTAEAIALAQSHIGTSRP